MPEAVGILIAIALALAGALIVMHELAPPTEDERASPKDPEQSE